MYSIFCTIDITTTGNLNNCQARRDLLSQQQEGLMQQESALSIDNSNVKIKYSQELSDLYQQLADPTLTDESKDALESKIKELQNKQQMEEEVIRLELSKIGMQENHLELQGKALDSQIEKYTKELESIEDAESNAIEKQTPHYNGIG